jgi:hypothetical protein
MATVNIAGVAAQVLEDMQNGMVSIEVGSVQRKAGILAEAALAPAAPGDKMSQTTGQDTVSESVWKRTRQTNAMTNVNAAVPAVAPDTHPYPKWPPGHSSGAFDAVSMKKSYILSPPEIYAECAHHGEECVACCLWRDSVA